LRARFSFLILSLRQKYAGGSRETNGLRRRFDIPYGQARDAPFARAAAA
jgi:hypothetical protein